MSTIEFLPTPIQIFYTSINEKDINTLINVFVDTAQLTDEGITQHGVAAIKNWCEKALISTNAVLTYVPSSATTMDDRTTVTFIFSGSSISYTIPLYFTFTLTSSASSAARISDLAITDLPTDVPTMNAVYAAYTSFTSPMSGFRLGPRVIPSVPADWVRVKISHASLNWHDLWTLRGFQPLEQPTILGVDGAGTLDDGTPVVLYPVLGSADWKGDETLDPKRSVLSEGTISGTFAEYVTVPARNAVRIPEGLRNVHAATLGTAWLTAYRMLFTKSGLRAGQTMLVQGASGGVSSALIQMGVAAGMRVWATGRNEEKRRLALQLGAKRAFPPGEELPEKVDAVFDTSGAETLGHSMESVKVGGRVISCGIHSDAKVNVGINLTKVFTDQITITGAYMGTLEEFRDLISFVVAKGIEPRIGRVVKGLEGVKGAMSDMLEGKTAGKIVVEI